jgi:hypothetical protein
LSSSLNRNAGDPDAIGLQQLRSFVQDEVFAKTELPANVWRAIDERIPSEILRETRVYAGPVIEELSATPLVRSPEGGTLS